MIVFPHSPYPIGAGLIWEGVHVGDGANSKEEIGWRLAGSLANDAILRCRFALPSVLPSGTPKLWSDVLAKAITGDIKVEPKWGLANAGNDPSSLVLTSEGITTVTWAAGDSDKYKELLIPLDHTAFAPKQIVVMDLTFVSLNWSLAVISTFTHLCIMWE